jgi:hypothetical protein
MMKQRSESVAESRSLAVKELEAAITHLSERNQSLELLTSDLTKREHDCEIAISALRDECQNQRISDAEVISELRNEINILKTAVLKLGAEDKQAAARITAAEKLATAKVKAAEKLAAANLTVEVVGLDQHVEESNGS